MATIRTKTNSRLNTKTITSLYKSSSGANYSSITPTVERGNQNNGGFLGGLGYLGEKIGVGFMSSVEGIWDYAAGGLAKLFGADDWAEQQFANDWFGDWYSHPEEWYNPSKGWQVAGDVAGGIGTSLPAIVTVTAAAAIAAASGGSLTPVSAGLIGASVAGFGAAGNATKQAYRETGQLTGKEFGYGALSGVTEGSIEGVTNALSLGTGQIVNSIAKSFAKETTKTVAKQGVVKTLAKGFIGEAFEEGMSEILDPVWQRMTYNPNAQNATMQEVAYAAFVGGMSGMIMNGIDVSINSGTSFLKGNSLAGRGLDAEVVGLSQQLAAFETANNTGDETFQTIAKTYADLAQSLATTDGKITTVTQKKLLGDLHRANTVAVFKPMIARSAANIVNNAEIIAERLNEYGYKTADGKPITFTAEQIRAGVEVNNPTSFSKALKTNSILRELAIADATGHLIMDTARFEQATLMGKRLASQVDLNRFIETATPSEISAVSQALGIENWETLDVDTFNQKIAEFVENGGVQQYADRRATVQSIQAIPAETARPMPKMVNLRQDGSVRYSDGSTQIAITKNGDAYTIYDYASGHLSKNMTRSEVNKLLRDYNTQQADILAGAREQMEAEAEMRQQAEELDTYARENISDYTKLNAPNQSMIRKVIREGRAKGMSDEDVLVYAKISAHAGIDIYFDKQSTFVGVDENGNEKYTDGFYDPKQNRIVVNPEAKRSHERLLLHELEHAILNDKRGRSLIATAFKNMDAYTRNKIIARYGEFYKGQGLDASKRVKIMNDEVSAHYAEEILSNKHALEKLVEAEPSMKDKILSFFKRASEDYASDQKLSKAARKYYKTYKKLFDELSTRNFQNNATEEQTKRLSGEVKSQRRALPDSIGAYSDEERKSIEARKDNITARSYDDVLAFFEYSISDKSNEGKTMFVGKISSKTAAKIHKATGLNAFNKSIALNSHDLRHMMKEHGDADSEAMRNQEAITADNFKYVIETIADPDEISSEKDEKSGVLSLIFKKEITGKTTAITIFSEKRKTLTLKTAWIIKKEQHISQPTNAEALIRTPEARSSMDTVPTDSITDPAENVNRNSEISSEKRYALPKTDSEGTALSAAQREYFSDSKVLDEHGNLMVMYHGTPNGTYTTFRSGSYFTPDASYADKYQNPSASSLSTGKTASNPKTYKVYLNITKPFDTRNSTERDIFQNEYYRKYGTGAPLSESGLPDWTDGMDLQEFIEEMGYDYDGLILDEGGIGGYGDEVISRGLSYVIFSSEQVKNVDNKNPTTDRDIRHALPDEDLDGHADAYSYENLTKKSDLSVITFPTELPMTDDGNVDTNAVVARGRLNARKEKNPNNTDERTYVRVGDIGLDVLLSKKGMVHGIARSQETAFAVMKIGDVLKNSVAVNELNGSAKRKTEMSYVLLGACRDSENLYVVRSVVSKLENDVTEIDVYQLSAVKGKKTETPTSALGGTGVKEQNALVSSESPAISIADFLEYVKTIPLANEVFSQDVAAKLGVTRSEGSLSGDIRYALSDENADGSNSAQDEDFDAETVVARGMPRTSGKSSMTVGELRKVIANNTKQKVYSKKDALSVVGRFAGISDLTQKTRTEIADAVWQILNESPDIEYRRDVAHDMAEFIVAKIIVDTKTENPAALEAQERLSYLRTGIGKLSFTEEDMSEIRHVRDKNGLKQVLGRWGYKGVHKGIGGIVSSKRTPMDVFVVDIAREMPGMEYLEEMHPVDAFLEIDALYERAQAEAKDKWISAYWDMPDSEIPSMVKSVEDEIMRAYETEGEQSKFSRMVENKIGYYSERAEYWKAEYDQIRERDRWLGLLMSKAQKMKDLKLGTFANSTQHDSEIFKNSIEQLARIQFRGNLNVSGTRKILADLRQWYTSDAVKTGIFEYVDANNTGLYVQGVADMLETLSESKKGFTIDDLKILYDVMSYFTNFVENWGKVFRQGKWIEAKPEAERYINTLHANENIKGGIFGKIAGTTYMQTFGDPMTVARRMDKYESGFYTEMMLDLRDAAVDAQVAEMEIRAAYDEFTKKHKKYVEKASVETVTYRGTEIPKMHLIGLYMTMKRKHAWAGLAANGFAFTDTKGNRVRVNGVVSPEVKITNAELEQYIKEQLSAIEELLSDTDKEYIAILEQAFNVDARKLKADRDMQRLGFTNATNDYYYPIRRGNIAKNVDTADIAGELDRVSNSSFNKDTVRGAKQELFIESADAVFNRHIHAVCQYAYLSPAVEAYNRLYNLDISGNKNKPISVATESANTWDKGNKYFVKLISDIQGIPVSSGEGMKALGFIRGSYAKFQLGANPKVWLTQLSSIFASSSLLDAYSITRGMAISSKGMDQYCSLAKLRNYDNTAAMAQGVLDSKAKRAVGAVSKFSDILMSPIGKMDRFVVSRIFGACQVQVEKNGGAKVGTEANKIEAGKLLRRVILETQQNSVATERSAAMRSGNEIMRTLTMFTSDSMKVVGRVIDSVGEVSTLKSKLKATTDATSQAEIKKKLKSANRKSRKAVGALCLTAVFMTSIAQLFRWLYDKEQDEDESVAETMLVDAVGNLFGGLPLFKDAYAKIFDGYDVDNYAYSAINDLLDSAMNLFEVAGNILTNEASTQEKNLAIRKLSYSVGQLFGVPVRNVYNVFFGLTKRFNPETAYMIDSAFYKKNYQSDLYKAIEEGDAEKTSFIMSLLLGERMSEDVDEAVFNELLILSKNGQKVIPRSVPSKITIDEVEYPLSAAEQAAIKEIYATSQNALKVLFAKAKYKTLSDEQKAEAIDYIYDTYYDKALENALGIDRGNNSLIIADVVGVDNLALLYVTTKGMTSDKDTQGKVVSGSKRKKVVAAINSLDVSMEKKLLLICSKGYSLQDNDIRGLSAAKAKKYLLRYILSLKGKTQAEKAQIAEMCGFEVNNGRIVTKTAFR